MDQRRARDLKGGLIIRSDQEKSRMADRILEEEEEDIKKKKTRNRA